MAGHFHVYNIYIIAKKSLVYLPAFIPYLCNDKAQKIYDSTVFFSTMNIINNTMTLTLHQTRHNNYYTHIQELCAPDT